MNFDNGCSNDESISPSEESSSLSEESLSSNEDSISSYEDSSFSDEGSLDSNIPLPSREEFHRLMRGHGDDEEQQIQDEERDQQPRQEQEEEEDRDQQPRQEEEEEQDRQPLQEEERDRQPRQDGEEDDDDGGNPTQFVDNYKDILHAFSKQWLFTQMSHKVSARATNDFWDVCFKYVPQLMMFHEREGRQEVPPKFISQRRHLHKQFSPEVQMEFGFKHKKDGTIHKVKGSTTPLKEYERNEDYLKLYEISTVKVSSSFAICFCMKTPSASLRADSNSIVVLAFVIVP